jgi:hypothetical protein
MNLLPRPPLNLVRTLAALLGLLAPQAPALGDEPSPDVAAEALRQVARHAGVFHAPPVHMPTRKIPDGPLLGNGDLGVAVGTVVGRLRYHGPRR